jgi:hypothetical protein
VVVEKIVEAVKFCVGKRLDHDWHLKILRGGMWETLHS